MTSTVPLFQFMPYGAPELQSAARPNLARALLTSSLLAGLVYLLAGFTLARLVVRAAHPERVAIQIMPHVGTPPPLVFTPPPPRVAAARPQHVAAGVPVPVLDANVPDERTIPDQEELSAEGTSPEPGTVPDIVVDPPLPPPDAYVYVEELPEPVKRVFPEYSTIARDAGVSGHVVVQVLVGKDGAVLQALVDPKHSVPMLDGSALAAARQWRFKPALANGHPVIVWVRLPFDFRLN